MNGHKMITELNYYFSVHTCNLRLENDFNNNIIFLFHFVRTAPNYIALFTMRKTKKKEAFFKLSMMIFVPTIFHSILLFMNTYKFGIIFSIPFACSDKRSMGRRHITRFFIIRLADYYFGVMTRKKSYGWLYDFYVGKWKCFETTWENFFFDDL